jgi:LPS export ABC transporter protein LptC
MTESPFGEMDNFVYTRTIGGEIEWRVQAARAQYFAIANEARFTQVDADLRNEGRQIELQSESGSIDLKARQGRLEGNVHGKTDEGLVFQTARMDFTVQPRRATTDQAVLLTGPSFSIKGVGMDLDLDRQTIRLKQNVEADWWAASKP